jgi:Na+-driven multidrug efflux pump
LTGCGKQNIGAHVNLAAFYLVGIPTAVLLAFVLHLNGEVALLSQSLLKKICSADCFFVDS